MHCKTGSPPRVRIDGRLRKLQVPDLTAADTVIHFDPWWNPAVEAQATDRAHRIGQKSVVTSYKLIMRGTVEEKILALQGRKKALMDALVDSEQPLMEGLSMDDLGELLA